MDIYQVISRKGLRNQDLYAKSSNIQAPIDREYGETQ